MRVRLDTLGGMTVRCGVEPVPIGHRKTRGLLAFLAMAPQHRAPRTALATLLWGEREEERARASLRQTLALLRKSFEPYAPDLLVADADTVALGDGVETDVQTFEQLCADTTPAAWAEALDLYQGDFLDGLTVREAGFEDWQLVERMRLRNLAVETLERLGQAQLDALDAQAAIVSGRRLVNLEPLRESAHRLLMNALARSGQRSAAIAQYRECRKALGEALRVQPEPETQRLFEEIRSAPETFAADEAATEATAQPPTPVLAERRQLTVMRCALIEAAAVPAGMDVEEYQEQLTARRAEVAEIIERYAGSVAQYTADGLVAYFGYPQAHEDDALRAIRAGLSILDAVRVSESDEFHAVCRIGIATGPVVVGGSVGAEAVGSALGLAEELHHQADHTGLVVSEATATLVSGAVVAEHVTTTNLVSALRVTALMPAASRFAVRVAQTLSPFVGREEELELLNRRWATVCDGEGQVVVLLGDAGIGKSRLLEELRSRIDEGNAQTLDLQCSPHDTNSVLRPFVRALERAIDCTAVPDAEARLQLLRKHLEGLGLQEDAHLGLMAALLSLRTDGRFPSVERMDARRRREHTLDALVEYFRKLATKSALLMAVEDIHWADASSQQLLSRLARDANPGQLFLLCTARPTNEARWIQADNISTVSLARLTRADSSSLARAACHEGADLSRDDVAAIVERSGGNPLFIEELARMATSSEAEQAISDAAIPATLQDLLMERLDALRKGKLVAHYASAIGSEFSRGLLKEIWEQPLEQLEHGLSELEESGLVYAIGGRGEKSYAFKHALVRDASYQSTLRKEREVLHGAIAEAIETVEGERAGEQAAILAYHYARSAHQEKAIGYALQAGDDAVRMHARPEATTHYGQALAIAQGRPDSADARQSQIDAIVKLASVGSSREDAERDAHHLDQAQAMAEALNDQPRLTQILYWRARLFYVGGDLRTALACAEHSLDIADRLDDGALAAWPVNLMGRLSFLLGDFPGASRLMTRSAEQMLALGDTAEEAAISGFAAVSLAHLGEFETAFTYAERGVLLAGELQNPFTQAAALQYRGQTHAERGNWSTAIADLEESRRIADEAGDAFRAYMSKCVLGYCHSMAGSPTQGRVLNEEALAFADQIGTTLFLGVLKVNHAHCLIALGDHGGAERLCREALDLANGEPQSRARAHHALARALHAQHCDPVEPADNAIREAIALDNALHYRPELARASLSYARMLRDWGQLEAADRYLDESTAMFREMGMEWDYALAEQLRER